MSPLQNLACKELKQARFHIYHMGLAAAVGSL